MDYGGGVIDMQNRITDSYASIGVVCELPGITGHYAYGCDLPGITDWLCKYGHDQ